MQEQCREWSEWRQNNSDAHKPSYVKEPRVPGRPTKSKQISMLVSQQVAAKMQKYSKSAHVDSTTIADKVAAEAEQHFVSMVQSAVAKHFATPPSQPKPII